MARTIRYDAGSLQRPRRTSQGYLRVDGWASRTGILEYRNPDGSIRKELREQDAVFNQDALLGFEGAPVTDDHPLTMVDLNNAKALTKGTVLSVGRRDGDHVAVSLIITDPDLIRKVETGKRQLSTGYYVELDETPGVHPQFGRYDARQVRVGPVNHLAVVERGRAGTASLRMDSMDLEILVERMDEVVDANEVPQDVADRLDAIAKRLDEWDEDNHPRAENGQFGSGGGGGGDKSASAPASAKVSPSDHVAKHVAAGKEPTGKDFDDLVKEHGLAVANNIADRVKASLKAPKGKSYVEVSGPRAEKHIQAEKRKEDRKIAKKRGAGYTVDSALDLHDANLVPQSVGMDLDAALARIKELETKLDSLEAGNEVRTDAAEVARLEGERDAARKDAEDAQALAAKTASEAQTEIAKARKDAEENSTKLVRESLDVLTKARVVLGADATVKVKLDGKDTDVALVEAPLRAVKCAVIAKVSNKTVDAKKHDAYVDAMFDNAIESQSKGSQSLGDALKAVTVRADADVQAHTDTASADPEKAAAELHKNRLSTAWQTTETK